MSGRLLAALLAAVLVWSMGGTAAQAAPATSTPRPTGTVALSALNGSGVTGTGNLKIFPTSDTTQIELRVSGLAKGSTTPWTVRAGTCADPGSVVFEAGSAKALRANSLGVASSTASVPLGTLLTSPRVVVVGNNAACGEMIATPAGFTVVALGLDNPRGLSFGPDGALYIAEAGRGGAGPCVVGPEGPVCAGATGAVTRVQGGANQKRIVTGLPSLAGADGGDATGPHDVAFKGAAGSVIIGLGANPAQRPTLGPDGAKFGLLYRLQTSGALGSTVDVAAYEATANPDGEDIDSNPYSVTEGTAGRAVVDAGGNSLVLVRANGSIETLATFPTLLALAPPFLGLEPGTLIPAQSVPTSVVIGPDGAYYVGELTGFPFPVGGARVWRVVPGQAPTIYATGFTNVLDLAFGRDGSLYVLEFASNGLLSGNPAGALKKVAPGGAKTTITTALVAPTGLAIASDGSVHISNRGTSAGSGQVLRFKP